MKGMKDMQSYIIRENFIVTESQREFKLRKPFIEGTINVYINEALQSFGSKADYITLPNEGIIIFTRKLNIDDKVTVEVKETTTKVLSYGSRDTTNAIFKRFSSVLKLNFNNRYKARIVIDNEPIEWSFSTILNPYWTTVKKIQEDIGEFIPGFTDEYIASMIHRNSSELLNRIQEAEESNSDGLNENAVEATITNADGEYENKSRLVNNWVRYKTEIDLIYARYFGISFQYGTKEKSVGDIKIRNERKLPYIDNLLEKLNGYLKDTENAIFGSMNFATSFQKGKTNYDYNTVARTVSWSS
jgi:hypothetical protein